MDRINGSLNFASLTHVKMEMKGKSGKPVKGMFVPFEANDIKETEKGGLYFNLVAFPMKEAKDWGTHIVKQSFSKEQREKMSEEEQREKPIIGNLTVDNTPSETVNDAGAGKTFTPDDDLPF